jgi:hypothetical protein
MKTFNINFYNFFQKKQGQRQYPYVYFYPIPLFAISKTKPKELKVHLGWLYFTVLFTYNK